MLGEIIRNAFRRSSFSSTKEWKDKIGDSIAYFTLTRIINQGQEPSLESFIIMAYSLDIPREEIVEACKAAGDKVWWKILSGEKLIHSD